MGLIVLRWLRLIDSALKFTSYLTYCVCFFLRADVLVQWISFFFLSPPRRCQCNGHSNKCSRETGENCACQNNTETDCEPKDGLQCWQLQVRWPLLCLPVWLSVRLLYKLVCLLIYFHQWVVFCCLFYVLIFACSVTNVFIHWLAVLLGAWLGPAWYSGTPHEWPPSMNNHSSWKMTLKDVPERCPWKMSLMKD